MKVLFFLLCLTSVSMGAVTAVQEAGRAEEEILQGRLNKISQKAIDGAIRLAASQLQKEGYLLEAAVMVQEWDNQYKWEFARYTNASQDTRDIGDHSEIWPWLTEKYNMLELLLGLPMCERLHLTALKIFNFTPKIVFRPKTFPMDQVLGDRKDEYLRHCVEGQYYYGLVPEATYWGAYLACSFASSGSGFILLCGTLGNLAEKVMAKFAAPKLCGAIYDRAVGQ